MNERIGSESAKVFIGLGSNLEPRLDYLKAALHGLRSLGMIVRISSVYETDPVGDTPQSDYLNAVVELHTETQPMELFARLKELERTIGRKERPRWHEREIDLDLLFYGDLILENPMLTIPHAELHRRAFVLVPMSEIASDFMHPALNKSVSELLHSVETKGVRMTAYML